MKVFINLKHLIFGMRVQGYPVPLPKFKSTFPNQRPALYEWTMEFKFGSRYGHRGSFYFNS